MPPVTNEARLEEELSLAQQNLEETRLRIRALQCELERYQSELMGCQLEVSKKTEEIRMFRSMYPDICKPPTFKTR